MDKSTDTKKIETYTEGKVLRCAKCKAQGGAKYKDDDGIIHGITLHKRVDARTEKAVYFCQFCVNS